MILVLGSRPINFYFSGKATILSTGVGNNKQSLTRNAGSLTDDLS